MKLMKTFMKNMAKELKALKAEHKQKQRDNTYGSADFYAAIKRKYDYRHYHIAYSMLRGKAYEQIEVKVAEGNEPCWDTVKAVTADLLKDKEANTLEEWIALRRSQDEAIRDCA